MSLADSIRRTIVPCIRRYPFIAIFAVASVLLGLLWTPLFWIGMVLTAWCAYFFRSGTVTRSMTRSSSARPMAGLGDRDGDSARRAGSRAATAPAHFRVHGRIFLPCEPLAHARPDPPIAYRPGKFLNAELDKASEDNERNSFVLDSPAGRSPSCRSRGWLRAGLSASLPKTAKSRPGSGSA